MTMLPDPDHDTHVTSADLARWKAELVAQFFPDASPAVSPIPWDRFRAEVLALYSPPLRAPATLTSMRRMLDVVAELGVSSTADLTPALVVKLIQTRPARQSRHTTDGLLRRLRTCCNYAVGSGYIRVSPFSLRKTWLRVSAPRVEKRRHHSAATIARALEIAREDIARKMPGSPSQWRSRRLYALVAIVAYTGMRKREALCLRVEDIDIPGRVINIVSREGNELKTEKSAQPIPMVDALAAILAEWLPFLAIPADWPELATEKRRMPAWNPDGKRDPGWVVPNIYRTGPWIGGPAGWRPIDRIKRLGQRAGVEGFTFLSLRHSWATMAESLWGLSDLQIQRVLRHTTVKTQQRYRHADLANLRQAVKGIGFGGESSSAIPPEAPAPAPPVAPPAMPEATPCLPARPINPKNPSKPGVYHAPKLTDADVAEARELRAQGWTYAALCARYGIAKSTLHSALYGMTHRDVPPA